MRQLAGSVSHSELEHKDADYIGAWLDVLREDNRAVVRAASQASKAADFLLSFIPDSVASAPSNSVVDDCEAA